MESKKALLIGVSEYASFPTLNFCENDAREMAKVLGSDPLGYDVMNLVGRVNSEEMRDAIRTFFRGENVSSKDTLLFYFSGHGVLDKYGDHYLASSETELDGGKGFWFDELDNIIEKSVSKRKVIVLDCCYAGALGSIGIEMGSKGGQEIAKKATVAIRKIRSGTGKCILSACLDTQEAESTAMGDLSIFTRYVVEGFKGLEQEYLDAHGNVTTQLIGKYVYDKITSLPKSEKPKQVPIIKTEMSGDIILATYPTRIKTEQRGISGKLFLELLEQGRIVDFNKMREQDQFIVPSLHRANLEGANLNKVYLQRANLEGANLRGANLEGANLEGANLERANLIEAKLIKAGLEGAYLRGAYLRGANLEGANLIGAYLRGANLERANLEGAWLFRANLERAYIRGTNLHDTLSLPISKEEAKSRGAAV